MEATMLKWHQSRKGYTTGTDSDNRITVFYDERKRGWKYVVNGEYSELYASVFQAIHDVEEAQGFEADRSAVEDIPPNNRPGMHAEIPPVKSWGGPLADEPAPVPPEAEPRKPQQPQADILESIRRAKAQARAYRQAQQDHTERMRQQAQEDLHRAHRDWVETFLSGNGRYRGSQAPWWVAVLELPPRGPYVLKDIRAQWVKLVKKYHPDNGQGDVKMFQKVQEAWEAAQATAR